MARSRLRQWQLVQEIATLGNLQKAAEAVGMSQPAATHALAELERLIGFPLFDRHARGLRPTPAGEAVLPKVRAAMSAMAECAELMGDMMSGSSGELRIGAIGAAINGLLCDAVPIFSERAPSIAVSVSQQTPSTLMQNLHGGLLDIVLARHPERLPQGIVFEPLLEDRYIVACSPRHRFAGRHDVSREELHGELWATPQRSTVVAQDFQGLWGEAGLPRRLCWVESMSPTLIAAILERRQALQLVPYNTLRPWLCSGAVAEVPGRWGPPLTTIGALYESSAVPHRPAVAGFVEVLRAARDGARRPAPALAAGSGASAAR